MMMRGCIHTKVAFLVWVFTCLEARAAKESEEDDTNNDGLKAHTSDGPKSLPAGEKAPIDLFKAVFQDSESEDSESSEDDGKLFSL